MLVQCPLCKELVRLATFQAEAGRLSFACMACHGAVTLQSAAPCMPPTPGPPPPPPPPSSAGPQPLSLSPPVTAAASPVTYAEGPDAPLWQAWDRVTADWNNTKAHDGFVGLLASMDKLPFAGTRYREHLEAHPGDEMAVYGRERILGQAMVLATARNDGEDLILQSRKKLLKGVMVGLAAAVLAAAVAVFSQVVKSFSLNP